MVVVNDVFEGVVECRLSEEEVMDVIDCGATDGGASGLFWIFDLIDGTKGFINGW